MNVGCAESVCAADSNAACNKQVVSELCAMETLAILAGEFEIAGKIIA